jgi:hypothetical protein
MLTVTLIREGEPSGGTPGGTVGRPLFSPDAVNWFERRRMNRYFRRLHRFGKSFSARRSHSQMTNKQDEIFDATTPQDVTSTRAKNERKGKVTADKWNQ